MSVRLEPDRVRAADSRGAGEAPAEPSNVTRVALVALVMAVGLLIVSYADGRARTGHVANAYILLWLGLIVVFTPALVHAWRASGRTETITVLVLLGLALYMVKVLDSPLHFTDHDEFSTLRTTLDIQRLGQPFHHDPLITVHPYFPGLELVTSALSSLSGASLFVCALIVIGLMRVLLMVALFLLFETVASRPVAALATILYAANPNFVFFNAQWAYESFSLPLALAAVALLARTPWTQWNANTRLAGGRTALRTLLLPFLVIVTVLVSHPLTSYALIVFLCVWAAIDTLMARRMAMPRRHELWWLAGSALGLTVLWTGIVGGAVGGYFGPVLGKAGASAFNLLFGGSAPKHLFTAPGVPPTPVVERAIAYGSVALALLALPFGLLRFRRQLTPLRVTLAIAALMYIPSLPLRLTQSGTEISNRASEFVYVGIAFLAALAMTTDWRLWRPYPRGWPRYISTTTVAVLAGVMFAGGIVIGWARYLRVPGPYLVVADERSVEPEGIAAAQWANRHLAPQNRILVDRANGLLMGSIGRQDPVGGDFSGHSVPAVLTAPKFDQSVYYVLRNDRIGYVVVDRRLATALPLVGVYVESDEPGAYEHTRPPTVAALLKYRGICPISLQFDSGNLFVFDTSTLNQGLCATTTTKARVAVTPLAYRYSRFSDLPVSFGHLSLSERTLVKRFDRLARDPVRNAAEIHALKGEITFLRDRLASLATSSTPGSWQKYWRRWRWQQLNSRLS